MNEIWSRVCDGRSGVTEGIGRATENFPENIQNRALSLSRHSAEEALEQAGWRAGDDTRVGLIVATTTGQLLLWDHVFSILAQGLSLDSGDIQAFQNQPLSTLMSAIGLSLPGFSFGPKTLLTSACSASTQAIGVAAMWIRQRRVKRCLVIGVEVLTELTTQGFRSLQLLSSQMARPFDLTRSGINLSEAGASLCLEASDTGPHPNALGYVTGFGFSTDAYHMTGPHPEGDGCFRAMQTALKTAHLSPSEIDWVYAHGTGSQLNDLAEGLAVSRLFRDRQPWVSSTKNLHGHPLAAAGALETAILVRAFQERRILKTHGLMDPDPKIPVRHPFENIKTDLRHAIKNTLGFGGTNAALVLSREAGGR
jgi:3-oxoacyl-[acyl-carrier-protein] synthase-1